MPTDPESIAAWVQASLSQGTAWVKDASRDIRSELRPPPCPVLHHVPHPTLPSARPAVVAGVVQSKRGANAQRMRQAPAGDREAYQSMIGALPADGEAIVCAFATHWPLVMDLLSGLARRSGELRVRAVKGALVARREVSVGLKGKEAAEESVGEGEGKHDSEEDKHGSGEVGTAGEAGKAGSGVEEDPRAAG